MFALNTETVDLREETGSTIPEEMRSSLTYDDLYTLYGTDILRVAYYYLGNKQQAEDITQEVFVKLITTSPILVKDHEKSWLLKVTLNKCRDYWRSAWVKKVVLGHPKFELFPDQDEIGKLTDSRALAESVNKLPPVFKEVVLLFYYQGYSISDISEMLAISEGTVSSRLSRARKRLVVTYCKQRFRFGRVEPVMKSRFVDEMELPGYLPKQPQPKKVYTQTPSNPFQERIQNLVNKGFETKAQTQFNAKANAQKFAPGVLVEHKKFGLGKILSSQVIDGDVKVTIQFPSLGVKTFSLTIAINLLKIVENPEDF